MTARILGVELRRSAARWAGLAALGVALAFLYAVYGRGPMWDTGVAWTEQWATFAMWSRFLLVLVLPVVAGAGALLGLRDHRSGMAELLASTPRPPAGRAAVTAGALAVALVGGYLALTVVAGIQIVANGGPFFARAVPVFCVGLLALVAAGLLGMGLGRTVPSALTPPLVAGLSLVALVTLFTTTSGGRKEEGGDAVPAWLRLLSPVEDDVRNPWLTVTVPVTLGQAAWLLGLAVTGFVLVAATRRSTRLAALVPAVLGLAVAVAVFPARTVDAYTVDPAAAAQVCAGQVCVTRMHAAHLDQLRGPAERALQKLSRLPNAPVRAEERVGDTQSTDQRPARSATTLYLPVDYWSLADGSAELEENLLEGAGTPACAEPDAKPAPGTEYHETAARIVAAAWLLDAADPVAGQVFLYDRERAVALITGAWTTLKGLPEAEQLARIGAVREAGLACDGRDPYRILTDGPAAR